MPTRPAPQPDYRRHVIGMLAIGMLLAAIALFALRLTGHYGDGMQLENLGWRFAAVLGLWWLAYPELNRVPSWFWLAIPVVLFLALVRFRALLVVIPVMILVGYLQAALRRR